MNIYVWWSVFSCASTFQPLLISLARIHATFKLVKDPDTFIIEMGNWLRLLFIFRNYWRFNLELTCIKFLTFNKLFTQNIYESYLITLNLLSLLNNKVSYSRIFYSKVACLHAMLARCWLERPSDLSMYLKQLSYNFNFFGTSSGLCICSIDVDWLVFSFVVAGGGNNDVVTIVISIP